MSNLIQQSNKEIVNKMIERLLIISNNYRIITMYGFDIKSHDKWAEKGSHLEVLSRNFNNSYITSYKAKINPYVINIKIITNSFNALNVEINNNGEIWYLYVKTTQDIEDIFCLLGNTSYFVDAHNETSLNQLNDTIIPTYIEKKRKRLYE